MLEYGATAWSGTVISPSVNVEFYKFYCVSLSLILFYIYSISILIPPNTSTLKRLTSSKQPLAPHNTIPIMILYKSFLSIALSQLNTITNLPKCYINFLRVSVLPEPALPYSNALFYKYIASVTVL